MQTDTSELTPVEDSPVKRPKKKIGNIFSRSPLMPVVEIPIMSPGTLREATSEREDTLEPRPPAIPKPARLPGEGFRDYTARCMAAAAAPKEKPTLQEDSDSDSETPRARKRFRAEADSDEELADANDVFSKTLAANKGKSVARPKTQAERDKEMQFQLEVEKLARSALDDWDAGNLVFESNGRQGGGVHSLKNLVREQRAKEKAGIVSNDEMERLLADEHDLLAEEDSPAKVKLSKEQREVLRSQKENIKTAANADDGIARAIDAAIDEDDVDEEELARRFRESRRMWHAHDPLMKAAPLQPPACPADASKRLKRIADNLRNLAQTNAPFLIELANSRLENDDNVTAVQWLFDFVANGTLSNKHATDLLLVARGICKRTPTQKWPLSLERVASALVALGAVDSIQSQTSENSMEIDSAVGAAFTKQERNESVARIAQFLGIAALELPIPQVNEDIPQIIGMLARLALDPESANLRIPLQSAISNLVDCLGENMAMRYAMINTIRNISTTHSNRYRHEIANLFPHQTRPQKTLRRWNALALLDPAFLDYFTESAIQTAPPYRRILAMINNQSSGSPFRVSNDMDDCAFEYATALLQIVLSDLWVDLFDNGSSNPAIIKEITTVLGQIDSRIHTDIRGGDPAKNRAKNAVTRLQHMLTYQRQGAARDARPHWKRIPGGNQVSMDSFFK